MKFSGRFSSGSGQGKRKWKNILIWLNNKVNKCARIGGIIAWLMWLFAINQNVITLRIYTINREMIKRCIWEIARFSQVTTAFKKISLSRQDNNKIVNKGQVYLLETCFCLRQHYWLAHPHFHLFVKNSKLKPLPFLREPLASTNQLMSNRLFFSSFVLDIPWPHPNSFTWTGILLC